MLSATPSTGKTTYAYDKENRLTKINKNTPLTYDANGNLLSKKVSNNVVAAYTWDYDNMLTGATISGTSYTYAYDPLGQRVKRVAGGAETRYITVGGTVLAEMDASNNITAYYVYGMGLISKVTPQGAAYYYHYDNLGSTIAITDSSGNIINKYAYDAFGKVLSQVEGVANPFKYVGAFGVMDEGNGLLYMRARYYDPATGRFISKDPIGWAGGLNLYAYTGNNPVNRIDPTGLYDFTEFGKPISLPVEPTWPYDPTFGPENCSAYPEGSLERSVCSASGSDEDTNCVRKCLQEKYPGHNGENNFCGLSRNPSDPWYLRDHPVCYFECGYPIN